MTDDECITLLQWLLPRLALRWPGFRRVRKQVCKRFQRRLSELGLDGADAYRQYLQRNPDEWPVADYLCRVTISRFNRDRGVFGYLADQVLPELGARAEARGATRLEAWSVGCASGEEPYTLALIWHYEVAGRLPALSLRILGTDIDDVLLQRAQQACYPGSALKALPGEWLADAFEQAGNSYRLKPTITDYVRFGNHDLRKGLPNDHDFDLVLCRNLAFTYFDENLQCRTAATLNRSLRDGGALVLGQHERLPDAVAGFTPWSSAHRVYRKLVDENGPVTAA
ncbi:MAG: chemotaxis protein CheR [Chromatiales bacterium]|nr:MAG: chemotaxis protein CheR [Chromatiales bacterium]